jgi:type II secretory pathway component PulF
VKRFRYIARRTPGDLEEGVLAAESIEAVARVLTARGLFLVSVKAVDGETRAKGLLARSIRLGQKRWRLSDQALFARQLADLLSGGLTIDGALAVLEGQARNAVTKSTLGELHTAVREGQSLSVALDGQEESFPRTLVSAVRAGEASGALEEVLESVAELLEQEDSILRKVREALTYPSLVAAVAAVTLVVLFSFVIPRVTVLYQDLEQVLPLPTRILLGVSRVTVAFGLPGVVVVLVGVLLFLRELSRSERLRLGWGGFLLKIPVVGRILFLRESVRFSRILGTLVGGGVPLLDSLGHSAGAIDNPRFSEEVRALRREIHEGKRLGAAMNPREIFQGPLTAMVRVGEESGDLPSALHKAARLYERELEGVLRRATTLLEPLLILVLGLFVAFVVFAMMLPILQMDLGMG